MSIHRRDLVSLFFGLVFALSGAAFLNQTEGWYDFDTVSLIAIGLISLGMIGASLVIVGSIRGSGEVGTHSEADTPEGSDDRQSAAGPT